MLKRFTSHHLPKRFLYCAVRHDQESTDAGKMGLTMHEHRSTSRGNLEYVGHRVECSLSNYTLVRRHLRAMHGMEFKL